MQMKIIAFSGKKQSGKTTAAEDLCHGLVKQSAILEFPFPIKVLLFDCFGATRDQLYGTEAQRTTNLPCGIPAREALNNIADLLREIDPMFLIRGMEDHLKKLQNRRCSPDYIFIPDVRTIAEAEFVHDRGGKIIRLTRVPFSEDTIDLETELDNYGAFDAVVDNSQMSIAEQNQAVWKLVREKGWI